MLTVHFLQSDGDEVHSIGPIPWLRAADGLLRAGPSGDEIARYLGSVWEAAGHEVTKCSIHASTCTARFEGDEPYDSTKRGPFDTVEFVDGSVYAQPGRRLLARYDEQERTWCSCDDNRRWSSLVVDSPNFDG